MITTLLPHVAPLASDSAVIEALEAWGGVFVDDDKGLMLFGVEGPNGALYRLIGTTSLWEATRIFEAFSTMGFETDLGRAEAGVTVLRVFRSRIKQSIDAALPAGAPMRTTEPRDELRVSKYASRSRQPGAARPPV